MAWALMTYLAHKLLVSAGVLVRAQRLLDEREKDGDNYACLQALSKADEINW